MTLDLFKSLCCKSPLLLPLSNRAITAISPIFLDYRYFGVSTTLSAAGMLSRRLERL